MIHEVRDAVKTNQQHVAGLLLGAASPRQPPCIEQCELCPADENASASFDLPLGHGDRFQTRLQDSRSGALRPIGFFRTQATGFLEMTESDRATAKQYLGASGGWFLIIRTTTHRPWSGALYSWRAGAQELDSPGVEFPFDEYLLRNGHVGVALTWEAPRPKIRRVWRPRLSLGPLLVTMAPLVGGLAMYWLDLLHRFPIARYAAPVTIQRVESSRPFEADSARNASVVSFAGTWTYPPNGQYHGIQPEAVEMSVHEQNGRLSGKVLARFKPSSQNPERPLRFEFSGDLRRASSQLFNLETSEGASGAIELIPGATPELIMVNFRTRPERGKETLANMILARK